MQDDDLVTVYTLTNPVEAEMVKNALKSDGIGCLLGGIEQASAVGLPGTTIQIQVKAMDADRARKVIEHHKPPASDG